MLRQEREGRPTYSCGVAILSRSEIDGLRRRPIVRNLLSYERKEIDGNKYHGNLLLHNSASKNARDIIANGLLLCVEEVVPQDA